MYTSLDAKMKPPPNPGDLILFHGRLAEIVRIGAGFGPFVLDVVDDGGTHHSYTATERSDLQHLTRPGECVLDAIQRTAAPSLLTHEKRRRLAEEWLANPAVGDVFLVEHGYLLELTEFTNVGWIFGVQHPYNPRYPLRETVEVSYEHDRQLRHWLKNHVVPIYRCEAFATLRNMGDRNSLLEGRDSPLFSSHDGICKGDPVIRYHDDTGNDS